MSVRAETQIDLARVDDGSPGTPGTNGATFTPSVAADGDISWTNDGGLPNPATQNIMGPQGSPGTPGTPGANGVSVSSVEPQYYLSTSDSSATGGSWSSTPPTFVSGYYYWTREYITYSDGTNGTSTEVYDAGMTQAAQDAYDAKTLADDTNQYFWYAPTGNDTGAHITEVPQDEWNDISDPNYHSGWNFLARSTGIAIRDGMTELATFGASGATIGVTDGTQSYLYEDYHSLQLIDKEGNTYFYASDLRDGNGEYVLTNTFIGDGSTTSWEISMPPDTLDVYVNNVLQTLNTDYTFNSSLLRIIFQTAPANGAIIKAVTTSTNYRAKAYTLGLRSAGSDIGSLSVAEGYDNLASGFCAHVEGESNTVISMHSHAEGNGNSVSAIASHAEGYHNEVSARYSHAEGSQTEAKGFSSHTQNEGTIAQGMDQTVLGKWNTPKGSPYTSMATDIALIIGNGTANNSRSNALEINWMGDVFLALNTNSSPGTTDGDLYAAITALGWESDVIV